MRVLVLSDSHRGWRNVEKALKQQPKAGTILFLGDGEQDFDAVPYDYPEKAFYAVKGNCDFASLLPEERLELLDGKRIFLTHGHLYSVKFGYTQIITAAKEKAADILLFGHTHNAFSAYEDGLHIMNPGSIREGCYGVIDLQDGQIICNLKVMGSKPT